MTNASAVRFEAVVLPHLQAAYGLARWLLRSDADAEDVVQEACLRALRHFDGFHGGDPRSWLLAIVRNASYTWLAKKKREGPTEELDDERHEPAADDDPESILLSNVRKELLVRALEELPVPFREVLVLRELEGLSYKEIGAVTDLPVGTVMSRLSRARDRLQRALAGARGGAR